MEGDQIRRYIHEIHNNISIHSLRMEGDRDVPCLRHVLRDFNPLPPHGGRPIVKYNTMMDDGISIHSLRMEGDLA